MSLDDQEVDGHSDSCTHGSPVTTIGGTCSKTQALTLKGVEAGLKAKWTNNNRVHNLPSFWNIILCHWEIMSMLGQIYPKKFKRSPLPLPPPPTPAK